MLCRTVEWKPFFSGRHVSFKRSLVPSLYLQIVLYSHHRYISTHFGRSLYVNMKLNQLLVALQICSLSLWFYSNLPCINICLWISIWLIHLNLGMDKLDKIQVHVCLKAFLSMWDHHTGLDGHSKDGPELGLVIFDFSSSILKHWPWIEIRVSSGTTEFWGLI